MITLRPYQTEIIQEIVKKFKKDKSVMISVPTGGGKTVIFCEIINQLSKKTLIIAHTTELVNQIKNQVNNVVDNPSSVYVKTIQSCSNRFISCLKKEEFDLLIIDECHRSMSDSYRRLIDNFQNIKILGVTATPFRTDKKNLHDIFGFPLCSLSFPKMIEEGILCDLEAYRVKTMCSLKGISTQNGDFQSSRLASVINCKERNQLIVENYKKLSPNERTIAFCASISHAVELKNEFLKWGIASKAIHGKIADKERKEILKELRTGKIEVVTNCNLLTEGFDEPSITTLLMCRPTLSRVLYIQMIGRGCRTYPGKSICKVIEFTDNEYDICHLEDIISPSFRNHPMDLHEKFSSYNERIQKVLLEKHGDTVIEKIDLTKGLILRRPASSYQIKLMNSLNIPIPTDISEHLANQLISKVTNG